MIRDLLWSAFLADSRSRDRAQVHTTQPSAANTRLPHKASCERRETSDRRQPAATSGNQRTPEETRRPEDQRRPATSDERSFVQRRRTKRSLHFRLPTPDSTLGARDSRGAPVAPLARSGRAGHTHLSAGELSRQSCLLSELDIERDICERPRESRLAITNRASLELELGAAAGAFALGSRCGR